jgi:hypothetical protein
MSGPGSALTEQLGAAATSGEGDEPPSFEVCGDLPARARRSLLRR